jgi:hypothetical protein
VGRIAWDFEPMSHAELMSHAKKQRRKEDMGKGGRGCSLHVGWFERGVVLLGRAHERSAASLR